MWCRIFGENVWLANWSADRSRMKTKHCGETQWATNEMGELCSLLFCIPNFAAMGIVQAKKFVKVKRLLVQKYKES